MKELKYLKSLGFIVDPFQHYNADKEAQYLGEYFISPDYFDNIWGDPDNPVANILYAPRGSGKTAQKVMLQERALAHNNIISINYSTHDLSDYDSIEKITIEYHLMYLNRLLLMVFLERLDKEESYNAKFSFRERQLIIDLTKIYLYKTPESFHRHALCSIKTEFEDSLDLLSSLKRPLKNLIQHNKDKENLSLDFDAIDVNKRISTTHKENFFNLVKYIKKVDFNCIYIFVDKVDEQKFTNSDVSASYRFVKPLLSNLDILETDGVAFKFFLWDKIKEFANGEIRHDRIFFYELTWSSNQLFQMLDKRVKTYSRGNLPNLFSLFESAVSIEKILLFSEFSPRDCIRLCKVVLTEQERADDTKMLVVDTIVDDSIVKYCNTKSRELLPILDMQKAIRDIGKVVFFIEDLTSRGLSHNTASEYISVWLKIGIISRYGTFIKENDKNRKVFNTYRVTDTRIAKFMFPSLSVNNFINIKTRVCNYCNERFINDNNKENQKCPLCDCHLNPKSIIESNINAVLDENIIYGKSN